MARNIKANERLCRRCKGWIGFGRATRQPVSRCSTVSCRRGLGLWRLANCGSVLCAPGVSGSLVRDNTGGYALAPPSLDALTCNGSLAARQAANGRSILENLARNTQARALDADALMMASFLSRHHGPRDLWKAADMVGRMSPKLCTGLLCRSGHVMLGF